MMMEAGLCNQSRDRPSCSAAPRQSHKNREIEPPRLHPAGGVCLLQAEPGRQRLGAIENGDVVEAEKAALEDIVPIRILAVYPPRVIQQQLLEDAVQKMHVAGTALHPLGAEHLEGSRCMNRRVCVVEGPFIRRDLAIRMQIALSQQNLDLVLGKINVDECQRAAMKSEVPGCEPRILPTVRHRDDIARLEMFPVTVAAAEAAHRRPQRITRQPALDVVVEKLLAPDHAGESLP